MNSAGNRVGGVARASAPAAPGTVRPRGLPKLLAACCVASPLLDVFTNVTLYYERPESLITAFKGLILVALIAHLRAASSRATIAAFLGIHLLRELMIGAAGIELEAVGDLTFFLRILTLISWLLVFHEYRRTPAFMDWTLKVFLWTATLSACAGLVGFAFSLDILKAYGDQRGGYKGLFFAENDTSIFYLIALVWAIRRPATGHWLFLVSIVAGIVLLGLGSKTALLGLLMVPALFLFFNDRPRRTWVAVVRVLLLYVLVPALVVWVAVAFNDLLDAIGYDQLTRVLGESHIVSALLSYRDLKVEALFDSIDTPLDLLFGVNIRHPYGLFGPETSGIHMIEIDAFDYLFRVGLLGIALTLFTLWRTTALSSWRHATPEFKVFAALIVITGLTVGHTLLSAMNGVWIAYFFVRYSADRRAPVRRPAAGATPPG